MSRRLADWVLSREELEQLFRSLDGGTVLLLTGLPADARVVGLHSWWERDCFVVRFASEEFGPVADGDPVPRVRVVIPAAPAAEVIDRLLRENAEMALALGDRAQDSDAARLAVAREREACARIAEAGGDCYGIAEAIRARGG